MTGRQSRFTDRAEPLRYFRVSQVLVRCPRCGGAAIATRSRVTCSACALVREGWGHPDSGRRYTVSIRGRCSRCGRPTQVTRTARGAVSGGGLPVRCPGCGTTTRLPAAVRWDGQMDACPTYSGLDLWLQTPCAGHVLWAYDEAHLDFLERYVAATLREQGPGNSSLASRLPRWIKSAKNRDAVGRALALLRSTLPG